MRLQLWILAATLAVPAGVRAGEPDETPKPIPATRAEIKKALEDLKKRQGRLSLPAPTEAEQAKGSVVNNARMRALHLSPELRGATGGGSREPDPAMTLDNTFKVYLFWITSRVNNCHYCLGHQEQKLAVAGVTDDTIAALDGDWAEFTPAERAAFAFTRKLTFEPHAITDADVAAIGKHYTPTQVLEIAFTVAGYNATNRWTDSLGIPAETNGSAFKRFGEPKRDVDLSTFLTPTSAAYRDKPTRVAPKSPSGRGTLEASDAVEQQLAKANTRKARLPLADEEAARKVAPSFEGKPVSNWVRLLAVFPKQGASRIGSLQLAREKGTLAPKLKAQMEYVAAREDRAWYALGHARQRLRAMGMSDADIAGLDEGKGLSEGDQAALAFTRKLTVSPQAMTDADGAKLRKHFSETQVAEVVHHTTNAAFFDRITEAAGLPLEE